MADGSAKNYIIIEHEKDFDPKHPMLLSAQGKDYHGHSDL